MGATIIDSLDTLLVMGMEEEFRQGLDWIKTSLNFNRACEYFESLTFPFLSVRGSATSLALEREQPVAATRVAVVCRSLSTLSPPARSKAL